MRLDTNFIVTDGKKIFGSAANRSHTTTYKISADHSDMCIIVPVFERPELEDCLNYCRQSLERAGKKASIIIVDQTLTKATLRKIQASLAALATSPSVTNIIYHHDISFTISGAKNYGLQLARDRIGWDGIGEYVMFLDSDVYLHIDTISELFRAAKDQPQVSAFSFPAVLIHSDQDMARLTDKLEISNRVIGFHKPEVEVLQYSQADGNSSALFAPAIHGCLFAVRASVLKGGGACFRLFFGMHGEHVELCARLRDRGHMLAYLMHVPIFHDDRPTVGHSVMRNLADREQYIIATIVAMMARNKINQNRIDEKPFLRLVRLKWLPNITIAATETKALTTILAILGDGLGNAYPDSNRFSADALAVIDAYRGSDMSKTFLRQGVDYICRNFSLLAPMFLDSYAKQPLYTVPTTNNGLTSSNTWLKYAE